LAGERQRETLERLREVLERRGLLAAAVFLSIFAVLGTATISLPALYRANAVLIVEPARDGGDLPGELTTRLDAIQQRLQSRDEALARARRLHLYPELVARSQETAVVEQMKKDTRITTRASADANGRGALVSVTVSYRGRDPETAALVCNSLAEFYVEEDDRLRSQRYAGRAEMLKRRLDETRRRLDDQERRFGDLRHHRRGGANEGGDADAAAVERLSARLRAVREERMRTLERRDRLIKQVSESDPRGAASTRLARLRQDLVERRLRLTDKHPDVLQLEAEVAALEQEAAAPVRAAGTEAAAAPQLREALREVEAELGPMKSEEARLSQELASYQDRLARTAGPRSISDASRDYQAAQETYGALLRRYEDAQLADSAEAALGSRLAWLDRAVPPAGPSGPPRLRLLLLALLAAMAAAAAATAAAEQLDDTFRSVDDIRAFTTVPVLATVASLGAPVDRQAQRRLLGRRLALAAVAVVLVAAGAHRVVAKAYELTSVLERGR
jgi:uncharacterized protein involved in exopolysaccharide biosynthesis